MDRGEARAGSPRRGSGRAAVSASPIAMDAIQAGKNEPSMFRTGSQPAAAAMRTAAAMPRQVLRITGRGYYRPAKALSDEPPMTTPALRTTGFSAPETQRSRGRAWSQNAVMLTPP